MPHTYPGTQVSDAPNALLTFDALTTITHRHERLSRILSPAHAAEAMTNARDYHATALDLMGMRPCPA